MSPMHCPPAASPASSARRRLCGALLAAGALLGTRPALADLARIRQNGTLKVAVYKGLPPFSAVAGSQYTGIDVALAKALASELGLQVSLLPFDADDDMSDDLRSMVWRGHYLGYGPADVMLHVPVDRTFMRANEQALIFAPYYRETFVLVRDRQRVPDVRGLEDLAGQPTGAAAGSGGASALLSGAGGALRDKVKIYPEGEDALRALFSGEIAAVVVTRAQYESALKAAGQSATRFATADISSPLLPPRGWAIGMAIKAGDKALAESLENALDAVRRKGELARIFANHGVTMQEP
ncbi:transporter substrate-binding domain-containing protein [Cupriavidus pinatubonensis]|uniref:substrate-binding periplasmic protein n=1 Tax=Cupriavidus pinatubonensis TaxID=248026 RepID=UPI0011275277|nr:transporter substrate-binding domain-containing protein [Cupriavidus pinatubonensis]QYY29993.1 transporter substrate-binding domain-containing protein [Cupriavidus pinatubonensis]TPQ37112.1 ABC transporter permease [Cupriavidus pinatubonensis]